MQKQDILEPGYFYHICNRGNNKEDIFIENKNYTYFLELISKHLSSIAKVYCYCLLKNHFHLLIRIIDLENLPEEYTTNRKKLHQPFSNLFNAYAKAINKAYNRSGSLFQEHFIRTRVTDEKYLKHLVIYIHLNPVKHGFTTNLSDYKYSSFNSFISEKPTKLERVEVIDWFNDLQNLIFWHDENKIKYEGIIEEIDEEDI